MFKYTPCLGVSNPYQFLVQNPTYRIFYSWRNLCNWNKEIHSIKYTDSDEYPWIIHIYKGVILGMGAANEIQRYNVTSSLIGWART